MRSYQCCMDTHAMQPPADTKECPTSWTERVRAAEAKEPPTVDESLHEPYIYIQIYKNYIVHRLYKYISISVQECNFGTILHEFLTRTYICMYIVWAQGEGRLSSTYFSCSSLKICEPVLNALVQGFELSLDTRGTYNIDVFNLSFMYTCPSCMIYIYAC